jgi:hypothetical protein
LEAGLFGLLAFSGERSVVDFDEAGDVAVFGFDDELGGGVAWAGLAQAVLHGVIERAELGRFQLGGEDLFDERLGFVIGERVRRRQIGMRAVGSREVRERKRCARQRSAGVGKEKINCMIGRCVPWKAVQLTREESLLV